MVMSFNQNMVMKTTTYIDTASYTLPGAEATKTTYRFTPETTDNVLIGVLWRYDATSTAGNESNIRLRVDPETKHSGSTQTDRIWYSHKNGKNSAGTVKTHWMWSSFANITDTAGAAQKWNLPVFAGKSSYDILLLGSGNSASQTAANIELKIIYFCKSVYSEGRIIKV